jgi:hypothetical protein
MSTEPPTMIVVDLRDQPEERPQMDPRWEWNDVTTISDPPWIRRYVRGRQVEL